ncbi:MAG: PocR ligand-binding domain-containing protein [Eubacteriales bacterium]|jgi:AraC-like DNA-binding protein
MSGIRYDASKLQDVIKDFCVITGVSVSVLDDEFEVLASYSEQMPAFCLAIQSTPDGKEKCLCSDMALLKRCRESGKAQSHICHAGVMDAALPISKDGGIIGYILIGRTRVADFSEIEPRLSWLSEDRSVLQEQYEQLQTYNDRQIHSMFELASMIVSFILTNEIIRSEENAFAKLAKDYVNGHLCESLSVGTLCRSLGVSKNALYERFRTAFGKTVGEYITEARLKKAKKLLCDSTLSIDSIAEQTGFASYTYFSRSFKKKYRLPPLAYRKAHKSAASLSAKNKEAEKEAVPLSANGSTPDVTALPDQ